MGVKIIIVGGSVTGLGLANMLEQHGVDYILLEAYPSFAPQVGASIGLVPSGLRILDQLGCYERLHAMAGDYRLSMAMRDLKGRLMFSMKDPGIAEQMEEQTGYPFFFVDRQMLLQVLFDNVQQKDRLLTNKRIERIEMEENGPVRVYAQDGSVYQGDIVVGADGVHSTVRREMWRIANESCPGTFAPDEEAFLRASTKCIFGISDVPPGFPANTMSTVSSPGLSYMTATGPEGRLYWFLFQSIPDTCSRDLPRWTKQDEEELASQHMNDHITHGISFGDVYSRRRATAMVPLEEHVFTRWYFKRIITLGDAAHKVHPLATLGGNGALEATALFCNALIARLDQNSSGLYESEINSIFEEVQGRHLKRAQSIVADGKMSQRWVCQLYPLSGLLMRLLLPIMGTRLFLGNLLEVCLSAPSLKKFPRPHRPHTMKFLDEQQETPSRSLWAWWNAAGGALVLGVTGMYLTQHWLRA